MPQKITPLILRPALDDLGYRYDIFAVFVAPRGEVRGETEQKNLPG